MVKINRRTDWMENGKGKMPACRLDWEDVLINLKSSNGVPLGQFVA